MYLIKVMLPLACCHALFHSWGCPAFPRDPATQDITLSDTVSPTVFIIHPLLVLPPYPPFFLLPHHSHLVAVPSAIEQAAPPLLSCSSGTPQSLTLAWSHKASEAITISIDNGKVLDDDNNGDTSFSLSLLELLQSCTTGYSSPFKSDYCLIGTVPVTYHRWEFCTIMQWILLTSLVDMKSLATTWNLNIYFGREQPSSTLGYNAYTFHAKM